MPAYLWAISGAEQQMQGVKQTALARTALSLQTFMFRVSSSRALLLSDSTSAQRPLCLWHIARFTRRTGQSGARTSASV